MKDCACACMLLVLGVVLLFPSTLLADPPVVTGTYVSEDGAIYYVQQSGNVVSWVGMSIYSELPVDQQLRRGLTYTNIFRGTFTDDSTINGDWVEVSRGVTLQRGSLILHVDTSTGSPVFTSSGGTFRTHSWTPRAALDDTTNVGSVFDHVYKTPAADGGTAQSLHDNLKPYRDGTVVYARVTENAVRQDESLDQQPPHVNYGTAFSTPIGPIDGFLDFGHLDRSYDSFWAAPDGEDGDFDFRLNVDQSKLEQDFWITGWGDLAPTIFFNKFNNSEAHSTLGFAADRAYLGAEGLMWGLSDTNSVPSLPGWAQLFNSILVNGRPVDGVLQLQNPTPDCNFPQPCPYVVPGERLQDGIQIGKQKIVVGDYVRVTGTLIVDCGHGDFWNIVSLTDPSHPCYDDATNSDDSEVQNQEIHPIWSIDIINYPFRPEDSGASARQNLTGTWGGSDGSTYYVRQVGNTIWWLGLPRDRQPMQRGLDPLSWLYPPIGSMHLAAALRAGTAPIDYNANCGPGTAIWGVLLGAAYPCWEFANVFKGTIATQSDDTATITGDWIGVPQSGSPGNAGSSQTFTLDAKRKSIQPVSSNPTIFPDTLQKLYEPEDTTTPVSALTVGSLHYVGSQQTFVKSSTPIKLTATDFDSGVQNLWDRIFAQNTAPPAYIPVLGSSTVFTLQGSDGVYEVDSYATDNAGNDEAAHANTFDLDNTPPQINIAQPTATQYPHSASLTINVSVDDGSGSGVQVTTLTLDQTTVSNNQTINLLTGLSLGDHTLTVDSLDNLNNENIQRVTFSVIVTAQSILDDVTQFAAAGKITVANGTSLLAILNAAAAKRSAGNCPAANNLYSAFISQVNALSGKGIDPAAAQIMIADAQYLIAHCP